MRDFLDPYGFKMPEIVGTTAGFSAQYQTVYDSFAIKPAADIATQQDTMVRALVSSGIWAKLDILYIFANNTRANAVINWINPGTYNAIEVNAPTFLAYRHFVGNGVNQYLMTGYNLATAGGNYALNDCHVSNYSRSNVAQVEVDWGCWENPGAFAELLPNSNLGVTFFMLNSAAASNALGLNTAAFFISNRDAAANVELYRNSVLVWNPATASTNLPNAEMYILARNDAGVGGNLQSTREHAQFSLGASLDESGNSEVTNFTNILETYLDYVGAGVIP